MVSFLYTICTLYKKPVFKIITLALFIHVLLVFAAFELYFSSPIDHGMTPVRCTDTPPSKRVVLIIADGLRADMVYGKYVWRNSPYLKYVRDFVGSWGVAHTRVPTESRPGHVAILAGIYEDPSAIFKGWQANPVDFDSVINQSTNAWCWGSPDIVNLFNKDKLSHIHTYTYDANMEDFGQANTSLLDTWVFDRVETFLRTSDKLDKETDGLSQSGNLFFLHLLGIDTAGHGFKPHSPQYTENIRIVDDNIAKIVSTFEETFPDGLTTYIFTSDHGMTNWGSHGAGSIDETETPFIAWGAGITVDYMPKDLKQIDIASFISCLLGINIPINSMGKLPYKYFDIGMENLSKMMISNARQLMEIFNVKRNRIKTNTLRFIPYKKISDKYLNHNEEFFNIMVKMRKYELFIKEWYKFVNLMVAGSEYYHNYYQLTVLLAITVGMVAWIIYLGMISINPENDKHLGSSTGPPKYSSLVYSTLFIVVLMLLYVQSLPSSYYFYFTFPLLMSLLVVNRYSEFLQACKAVKKIGVKYAVAIVCGLELLVIGFHYRQCYSLVLSFIAIWVSQTSTYRPNGFRGVKRAFSAWSLPLAIFPLLPVMITEFKNYLFLCGAFVCYILMQSIPYLSAFRNGFGSQFTSTIFEIQQIMFLMSLIYSLAVEFEWIPIDSPLKVLAWPLSVLPIFLVRFTTTHIFSRICVICLGFLPFYLLVSPGYELLFLAVYTCAIYYWMQLELSQTSFPAMNRMRFDAAQARFSTKEFDEFRRGFLYIAFFFVGFFGTGNIASLNSFDPMWVRCFLTVFSPFKMTAIILIKIMVPFLYVTCVLRAFHVLFKNSMTVRFCILLFYSDIMLIQFLYQITNVGSWLDIGTSLSHFIIMDAFVIIILFLYGVVCVLTTTSKIPHRGNVHVE